MGVMPSGVDVGAVAAEVEAGVSLLWDAEPMNEKAEDDAGCSLAPSFSSEQEQEKK